MLFSPVSVGPKSSKMPFFRTRSVSLPLSTSNVVTMFGRLVGLSGRTMNEVSVTAEFVIVPSTVNGIPLLLCNLVTATGPDVAPDGTVAAMLVSLHVVTAPDTP